MFFLNGGFIIDGEKSGGLIEAFSANEVDGGPSSDSKISIIAEGKLPLNGDFHIVFFDISAEFESKLIIKKVIDSQQTDSDERIDFFFLWFFLWLWLWLWLWLFCWGWGLGLDIDIFFLGFLGFLFFLGFLGFLGFLRFLSKRVVSGEDNKDNDEWE